MDITTEAIRMAAHEASIIDGIIPETSASTSASASSSATNDQQQGYIRRGKWTSEEEAYVTRLIDEFKKGTLPIPNGITLRTFLSKLLNCDPMRISKKFVGNNCIGKVIHTILSSSPLSSDLILFSVSVANLSPNGLCFR